MNVAAGAFEVLNSLLWIRDPTLRALPEIDGLGAVWHTPACVAVSCLPDCDGATKVVIGPSGEVDRDVSLVFDGELLSPSRTLIVDTVMDEELLRVEVPRPTTRVRIWTNGHHAAENVVIGLD
jgi:hypothetical protein